MWKDPLQSLVFVASLSQQVCGVSHFPVCLGLEVQQECSVEKAVSHRLHLEPEEDSSGAIMFPRSQSSVGMLPACSYVADLHEHPGQL